MSQYRMVFFQTPMLTPIIHWRLTEHGNICMQINQLPTKTLVELQDNSNSYYSISKSVCGCLMLMVEWNCMLNGNSSLKPTMLVKLCIGYLIGHEREINKWSRNGLKVDHMLGSKKHMKVFRLAIEIGRWIPISSDIRLVWHFPSHDTVEDDAHFVLGCPLHKFIRAKYTSQFENAISRSLGSFFQIRPSSWHQPLSHQRLLQSATLEN